MACSNIIKVHGEVDETTQDETVDRYGHPAIRHRTGAWIAGILILLNQGLATLAFFGVEVNLVLFFNRVLLQDNVNSANNASKWTGTVYIFSLLGAFLSDCYLGRFKSCVIFQTIFVLGLVSLSLTSYIFLLKPHGCGSEKFPCESHSTLKTIVFHFSLYTVALGNGGYQPNIATFGADQFDENHPKEEHSKVAFFSYFYLAFNLGSVISDTILAYFENQGMWALGFWVSTGSAVLALLLFLTGTPRYRHFKPRGNPVSRFCQVLIAAIRNRKRDLNQEDLFETHGNSKDGGKKMQHTKGFKFLDRAALVTADSINSKVSNPRRLITVTQVEEVKCILRLLPIWLCTIFYSAVYTQMTSLFVEQGAAMKTTLSTLHIPPASMSIFNIISVAIFIFTYRQVLDPLIARIRKQKNGLTELQRMGIGLVIAAMAMVSAGIVEVFRLKNKYVQKNCTWSGCESGSSLSILWQTPQYAMIGASEVFMYVSQLEFFNDQSPDGLKSFGSALSMSSMSLGNYVSSILVTVVMKISTKNGMPGWIPENLNRGHLDRVYFLLAALTTLDFIIYIFTAKWYQHIKFDNISQDKEQVRTVSSSFIP